MRPGYDESPLNPLPAIVWLIVGPIALGEVVFALHDAGFFQSISRVQMIEKTAFVPDFLIRLFYTGDVIAGQMLRIFAYPFVHYNFLHAAMVMVFTLALGNMVARVFRPLSVAVIFVGSAVVAALVYTVIAALIGGRITPLVGGYPAVYGLVGAFTYILQEKLRREGGDPRRAFILIGSLAVFQAMFWVVNYTVYGTNNLTVLAEMAGFAAGYGLSYPLAPGGWARLRRDIRHR